MQNAQIDKHITNHTARYDFAVLILAIGGDLYCQLVNCSDIHSTQVYTDVVMETKIETVSRVSDFFSKQSFLTKNLQNISL